MKKKADQKKSDSCRFYHEHLRALFVKNDNRFVISKRINFKSKTDT